MASTISAGTTSSTAIAITGDTTGNLAFTTQAGTNTITVPNVTGTILTNKSAGAVLQVVQATSTTTYTYSSAQTWTSASSFLSASITPSSSSNKIMVIIQLGKVQNLNGVTIRLTRGGSAIFIGDAAGSRPRSTISSVSGFNGDGNHSDGLNISYLDSPATTSSTAYSFDSYSEGSGTTAFNRSITDGDNTQEYSARTASSIILMEIAG